MNNRFRLKLFLTMIGFAIVISFTIATIDYLRMRDQAIDNNQFQIQKIEDTVNFSLQTIEKAIFYFDNETALGMEKNSRYLLKEYEENPNFDKWDFQALKESLGMDIYVINNKNIITHSNFQEDIGLDFNICCAKLVPFLDERRKTGQFYHEGLDIEQKTGEVKKYSYMATKDRKYLIELGYSLKQSTIFNEFNFLQVNKDLVNKYQSVNEINVLNIGGLSLGNPVSNRKLSKERRDAFEKTLKTKQIIEVNGLWEGKPAIYRYVPYESEFDEGTTKNKVIEIIYNDQELKAILKGNSRTFLIQLLLILAVAMIISFLISRWVAMPMHLAFHDSLTGLKNRAAFDDILRKEVGLSSGITALLMIDIDNFKTVNDRLGHDKGDQLLRRVAKSIQEATSRQDIIFRYGGDEFILIMNTTDKEDIEKTAKEIITQVQHSVTAYNELLNMQVSASVGIATAPEHADGYEALYKKADIALYASKEKGKNQYQFYSAELSRRSEKV